MLIFAPGFGAGAVGGYAVARIDPAIVAAEGKRAETLALAGAANTAGSSSDDLVEAFGG